MLVNSSSERVSSRTRIITTLFYSTYLLQCFLAYSVNLQVFSVVAYCFYLCEKPNHPTRPGGLEPPIFGFEVRDSKNTSPEKVNTCEIPKEQLTPKNPKRSKIDTSELPADLTEIVTIWPKLPEYIKAAITALVKTANN